MAETKIATPDPTIVITSVQSLVDHTYEGVLYPAGSIYNADARELDNLEHHVKFARSASGAARDASPTQGVTPPTPRPGTGKR